VTADLSAVAVLGVVFFLEQAKARSTGFCIRLNALGHEQYYPKSFKRGGFYAIQNDSFCLLVRRL